MRLLASHRIVWPAPRDFDRVLADFALGRAAHKIGLADAMIGETAVGLDVPIHPFNARHFRAIPGLLTVRLYLKRR